MKHEWDYVQGGKTSVKMYHAPGNKYICTYIYEIVRQFWDYHALSLAIDSDSHDAYNSLLF